MLSKLSLYYHTLKYLKPIQWYGQLRIRFIKPKVKLGDLLQRRLTLGTWCVAISKPSPVSGPDTFTFLNQTYTLGPSWSSSHIEKLWLYHLHYFDLLNANLDKGMQADLITRWISANPPQSHVAWEPYPLSLRIVNWIKWALQANTLSKAMIASLTLQIRYLYQSIEVHILGNHVLANAKALLFAGLFFEGREAAGWYQRGVALFKRELAAQILADGGHFELSPMYHCIILEDLLDVLNLYQTYGRPFLPAWQETITNMFAWLRVMQHYDGEIPFFNDAALEVAPNYAALLAYYRRLGGDEKKIPVQSSSLILLPFSGYCRLQKGKALLIADVAEIGAAYQPGHAHADTLSFEFSIAKNRFLVNAGTSTYRESAKRLEERSTCMHNTLVINHENSSEVWKSFRVARRAHVFDISTREEQEHIALSGSHNGYVRRFNIVHQRTWILQDHALEILDQVLGNGNAHLALYFHCHPDIIISPLAENCLCLTHKDSGNAVIVQANYPLSVSDSTYHPQFNITTPTKKICCANTFSLPTTLRTSLKWS